VNSQKVSPKSRSSSFWTVASSFSFRHPISPWGDFQLTPQGTKPLDETFLKLKDATEILQYLTPLPSHRAHDPPPSGDNRPSKIARTEQPSKGKGKGKGGSGGPGPRAQLPDGCVTHDDDKRPPCFAYQSGKCKFKGPPARESGALVDITSATRKVAIGQNRTTCATTQTEGARKAFHQC
jgi:hypothetical protein